MSWREILARRAALFGINRRNVELIYPHNSRRDWPIADDKRLAKAALFRAGVPTPATIAECASMGEIEGVVRALLERERFVIKPAQGSRGRGIVIVGERTGPGAWRVAGGATLGAEALGRHMAAIVSGEWSQRQADAVLVEERIEPHPVLRALWAEGLADVRVLTLEARPLLAMLRVPAARSAGRANLHQGGVGLAVELATGRTVRAVQEGRVIERHPDSGAALIGLIVPAWTEVLDAAVRAARAVPLGYLGVDLAVDEGRGVLVVEINARPGLEIQNVHGEGLGEKGTFLFSKTGMSPISGTGTSA